jgi:sugar lactone lactonase YvrE
LIPTSISLSAAGALLEPGQSETFTATVTTLGGDPIPGATDGTVTFLDGQTAIGTATLAGSPAQATFTTMALAAGPHTITASYSGDNTFAPSASGVEPASAQSVVPVTGLSGPYGVAVDGAGDLFIVDAGHNQVLEVTPGGTPITVASGLSVPSAVAVDASADVFIADTGNNRVVELPAHNGTPTTIGSGLNHPNGVAVDALNDVFIADSGNNRVLEFPSHSTPTTVGSGLNSPTGVAVDNWGDVFIADRGHSRVVEVSANGGTQTTVGSGLNAPAGVAVDGSGDVFIADTGNNRVVEVKPDGTQATVGSGLNTPTGVAVDGSGDLFTADFGNSRVVEADRGRARDDRVPDVDLGQRRQGLAGSGAGRDLHRDGHHPRRRPDPGPHRRHGHLSRLEQDGDWHRDALGQPGDGDHHYLGAGPRPAPDRRHVQRR